MKLDMSSGCPILFKGCLWEDFSIFMSLFKKRSKEQPFSKVAFFVKDVFGPKGSVSIVEPKNDVVRLKGPRVFGKQLIN